MLNINFVNSDIDSFYKKIHDVININFHKKNIKFSIYPANDLSIDLKKLLNKKNNKFEFTNPDPDIIIFTESLHDLINKKLTYNNKPSFHPLLKESNFLPHNIIKYNNTFFAAHISLGPIDVSDNNTQKKLIKDDTIGELIEKIVRKIKND